MEGGEGVCFLGGGGVVGSWGVCGKCLFESWGGIEVEVEG